MRRTIITRVKNTPAQSGLSRQVRQSNIRGAFKLQVDVRGRRLAIVDDVVTTGATTGQLARVCKVAGASEVQIWAVTRTDI
jgi:predicted amidophosphoribosyltransferase